MAHLNFQSQQCLRRVKNVNIYNDSVVVSYDEREEVKRCVLHRPRQDCTKRHCFEIIRRSARVLYGLGFSIENDCDVRVIPKKISR